MSFVIGNVFRFKPDPALFEVYVQDFNDDYHRDDFPEEELEARKIKGGRYRNFYKYMHDKDIYETYMRTLKEKYPKSIYKSLVRTGELGVFIPNKMEYKPKRDEKIIPIAYKEGIYISQSKKEIDYDLADNFIDEFWKENNYTDINSESLLKAPKDDRKLINKIIDKDYFNNTGYEVKKVKKKDRKLNDVDFMSELYLINSSYDNKGNKKTKKKNKGNKHIGIKLNRYISGKYLKDLEKEEKMNLDTVHVIGNSLMSVRDQHNMEIYDLMRLGGHQNVYNLIRKRKTKYNKKLSKIYKKQQKYEKSMENYNSLLDMAMSDSGSFDYNDFITSISELYTD